MAPQTVTNAINALRNQGLIVGVTGSGWYVRPQPRVMRLTRSRLSRAERAADRGIVTSDAHADGPTARADVNVRVEPARDEVAAALEIAPGTEVLVRDRVMFADDDPVQLATSHLPREITRGTAIEHNDAGAGGVHARLEESGHALVHFQEAVRIGQASEHEAALLSVPVGSPLYRIRRVAHAATRPVEANVITAVAERYELFYELPAE